MSADELFKGFFREFRLEISLFLPVPILGSLLSVLKAQNVFDIIFEILYLILFGAIINRTFLTKHEKNEEITAAFKSFFREFKLEMTVVGMLIGLIAITTMMRGTIGSKIMGIWVLSFSGCIFGRMLFWR